MKRVFVLLTLLVLAGLLVTALGLDRQQTALAQDEQPTLPAGSESQGSTQATTPGGTYNLPEGSQVSGGTIQAVTARQMSYQGRLLIDGQPCQGPVDIRFRLWTVATLGTAIWDEIQTVTCDNGVFSVMLGQVNPLPVAQVFQRQLWLGVKPVGAAAELKPRQLLGTVPYAMNLIPGATVVDSSPATDPYLYSFWVSSDNHAGIFGSSSYTDSIGINGNAYGSYGGYSNFPTGVNGSSNNGIGVYGTTFADIGAECNTASNTPCRASVVSKVTTDSYGIYSLSTYIDSANQGRNPFFGINNTTGWYTAYFQNRNTGGWGLGVVGDTYLGGDLTVTGAKSGYVVDISLNAGSEPLERGDVVAVVGVDAPVMGEIPVMRVAKADATNASAIVGIVDKLYLPCDRPEDTLEPGAACGGFVDEATTIQPGQYFSVVTLGAYAYLKADASYGAIKAGDLLSISPSAGVAGVAQQITVSGVSFYAPGTIIGKALGTLDAGTGYIAVFVSLK